MEDQGTAIRDAIKGMPGVGEHMPNGAVIVAIRWTGNRDDGSEFVVLAVRPNNREQYVTWRRFVGVTATATSRWQRHDYCWLGHYFENLEHAIADYDTRPPR